MKFHDQNLKKMIDKTIRKCIKQMRICSNPEIESETEFH